MSSDFTWLKLEDINFALLFNLFLLKLQGDQHSFPHSL